MLGLDLAAAGRIEGRRRRDGSRPSVLRAERSSSSHPESSPGHLLLTIAGDDEQVHLVIFDIDVLEAVNDSRGRTGGDAVIRNEAFLRQQRRIILVMDPDA